MCGSSLRLLLDRLDLLAGEEERRRRAAAAAERAAAADRSTQRVSTQESRQRDGGGLLAARTYNRGSGGTATGWLHGFVDVGPGG